MLIEDVRLFYLAMPEIQDIGDGSQDALLIRIESEGIVGWGECESSPLVSIANWICPMSHYACKSVRDAVVGQRIETPEDIVKLGHAVRAAGLDIAQTDHTWSGVEIALWDLLGKRLDEPVYRLLGFDEAFPKTPYASQLFGDTPDSTLEKARQCRQQGFSAVKFGWASYGRGTVAEDNAHVEAARAGLGEEGTLLIDAGTVWNEDVDAARQRLAALEAHRVLWLEEPFVGEALHAYGELAKSCHQVQLAGGEGASNFHAARNLIDHGGIGFVQIDTGRIGGIAPAKAVADYAAQRNVVYVNHTFTTHLALAASIVPYAGDAQSVICEFPVEASRLALDLVEQPLSLVEGKVQLNDRPGLGVDINEATIEKYLVPVEIKVRGKTAYSTPGLA